MFVVLLRFAHNKHLAAQFMDGHKAWIKRGLDDGVFLLIGSIRPNSGGAVIAQNVSLTDLQERVHADPFVAEDVVSAEIIEIMPSLTDERLAFLAE